jgi:hypothetical protein
VPSPASEKSSRLSLDETENYVSAITL